MGRIAALVLAVALVGACSSGSDDDTDASGDASSTPTTAAESTSGPVTTTEALTDRVPLPVPATSPPPTLSAAAGIDPDELLASEPPPRFALVELPDDTDAALEARFRSEDVVEEVLRGVGARGVQLDGETIGVVVVVAISPPVAADTGFQREFQAQATDGAEVDSEPLRVGEQEMVRFDADGVHSALWQHENVFVLVSSRDPDDLLRSTRALVSAVVAPVEVDGDTDGDLFPDPPPVDES